MSGRLADRAETVEMVCEALEKEDRRKAGELVRGRYPFDPPADRRRPFSKLDRARVFLRDGFIDRYGGDRLFFPPVLEVISMAIPDDFPTHPNGKFSECHAAHWELYSSVDHLVPVARGGAHEMGNWVTTSMMRNLVKSHWRLEDLGWELLPPGRLDEWDGMLGWFLKHAERRADLLADGGVRDWHKAAVRAVEEIRSLPRFDRTGSGPSSHSVRPTSAKTHSSKFRGFGSGEVRGRDPVWPRP